MALHHGLLVALQVAAPDSSVPTAIERALIEHRCNATRPAGVPDPDAYQECLSAQLVSLRTDFGPALGLLSGSERSTIDSACSKIDTALSGKLMRLASATSSSPCAIAGATQIRRVRHR